MTKTTEEHIQLLDNRIEKVDAVVTQLEVGNKNDKVVAELLRDKVNKKWVAQKEELEGKEPK